MKLPVRNYLDQLLAALHEGAGIIDTTSAEWPIEWFNPAFAEMTALRAGAVANQSARELVDRLGGSSVLEGLSRAIGASADMQLTLAPSQQPGDGPPLILTARPLLNRDQTINGKYLLLLSLRTAVEQQQTEETLRLELEEARRQITDMSDDPITGLASEMRFKQLLKRDWAAAVRGSSSLSVVSLAFDEYEAYLGTFGEHATDACLRMVARTIRRRLRRGTDLAGRLGQCTIAVMMNGGEREAVESFAGSIVEDVKALHIHHPKSSVAGFVTVTARTRRITPTSDDDPLEFLSAL